MIAVSQSKMSKGSYMRSDVAQAGEVRMADNRHGCVLEWTKKFIIANKIGIFSSYYMFNASASDLHRFGGR